MTPGADRESVLQELARSHAIQSSYIDAMDQPQRATDDDLRAILGIMGIDAGTDRSARDALVERNRVRSSEPLPPITVAWNGEKTELELVLPKDARPRLILKLESGESRECSLSQEGAQMLDGRTLAIHHTAIPPDLPAGYHAILLETGADQIEGSLFTAPAGCYSPKERRSWGVFAPAYAIHSDRSWGAGDLTDVGELFEQTRRLGGAFVGILPILAAFLEEPFEPSPYNPMSRLHWNELFLDVTRVPGFTECPAAKELAATAGFQQELARLQTSDLVDYRGVMKLKRRVLEETAGCFFGRGDRSSLDDFIRGNADVERYAAFRAVQEKRREPWRRWPEAVRSGLISESDYDEDDQRYHLFVQWAMHLQLDSFSERAGSGGRGLYLDYPLGVHPDGYDTWNSPDLFAEGTAVGAPPDAFFTKGQNWGFPPMRPDVLLERRLDYFIAAIRNQLKFAGMLRIDHVMALNRLFWIPAGAEASRGVYVQYPAEAMYAVLAIESHRHQSVIIGEDLGTVPAEVRAMMKKRGVRRMYVLQYEASPGMTEPPAPSEPMVASINTHDMPTFTAYWKGLDIGERRLMGLLDEEGTRDEQANRETIRAKLAASLKANGYLKNSARNVDERAALPAVLDFLSSSEAEMVLVNLEDLWAETEPQNVPGTSSEDRPNWQRKLPHEIDGVFTSSEVAGILRMIDDRRKHRRKRA